MIEGVYEFGIRVRGCTYIQTRTGGTLNPHGNGSERRSKVAKGSVT